MKPVLGVLAALLLGMLGYLAWSGGRHAPEVAREEHLEERDGSGSAPGIEVPPEDAAVGASSRQAAGQAPAPSPSGGPLSDASKGKSLPVARIDIQVLDAGGTPASGTTVATRVSTSREAIRPSGRDYTNDPFGSAYARSTNLLDDYPVSATTDGEGRTSVLVPPRHWGEWLTITASLGESVAYVALAPPQETRSVVLTLAPLATAEVRVVDAEGLPLIRGFVEVRCLTEGPGMHERNARTDEQGIAAVQKLSPGEYEFTCADPRSNRSVAQRTSVAAGERAVVVLRLPPDDARVAASGTVVDERGAPLGGVQVRAVIDGSVVRTLTSDARGEFRLLEATGREVEFSIGGMWDDEFEPATLRVPIGTRNAGFRRVRTAALLAVEIVCIDGTTGRPVDARRVGAKRYRAGRPDERADFRLSDREPTSLIFRDHADWRVEVIATGYHGQDLPLAEAAVIAPDRRRLVFRLERAPHYQEWPRDG